MFVNKTFSLFNIFKAPVVLQLIICAPHTEFLCNNPLGFSIHYERASYGSIKRAI